MFMCKINVDRSERKKIMKKKQDYEAMEPWKKKNILRKKTSQGYDKYSWAKDETIKI